MNNKYAVGDKVMYKGIAYTVVDFRIPKKKHEELVYDLAECDGDGEMLDVREFDISPFTTDKETKTMSNKENEKKTGKRKFTVSLQVDTRIEIDVFAENALEAGRLASDEPFEMKDLEFIESHMVSAYDVENNELTDLC